MRDMKDSGIEWVGNIPANWKSIQIKHLFSILSGATPTPDVDNWDGDVIWITPADYKTKDKYVVCGKRNISQQGFNSCSTSMIPKGSIIFSKRAPIGTVAINKEELCTNQGCLSCVSKADTYNDYFYYVMSIGTEHFELLGSGTTFKEISANSFSNCKLPCPNKTEQERIAVFLDEKCVEFNTLISDIQSQIETLEEYKRSVITEAVTKGLDADVEMKDSGIAWVGDVPAHWSVMPNKYVMHKIKKICPKYNDEDILSLTMNGVIIRDLNAGGKMPTSFDGYQYIEPNNLLVCLFDIDVTPRCVGLIKNYGLTSPAYSQFIMNDNAYAPYYNYYYTMIDNDKTLLHLAKNLRHSLTEDQLGSIAVIVPPILEQERIASYLDDKCQNIDLAIEDKQKQIETIEEYKKSLIFEYVTGKKEVEI